MRYRCSLRFAAGCRFTQVRARKLAEAAAAVNELLMQANGLVNQALAAPDATAAQLDELVSQVRQGVSWAQCWGNCRAGLGRCALTPCYGAQAGCM